jgi:hypothetical protein
MQDKAKHINCKMKCWVFAVKLVGNREGEMSGTEAILMLLQQQRHYRRAHLIAPSVQTHPFR